MTTSAYPRLPEPPAPTHEETAPHYGGRILCFLLAHEVTATIPTPALEHAQTAVRRAIATRTDLGTPEQPAPTLEGTHERLNRIAHLIARTLQARQAEKVREASRMHAQAPGAPASAPGGQLTPISRPPWTQPPGGAQAQPPAVRQPQPVDRAQLARDLAF